MRLKMETMLLSLILIYCTTMCGVSSDITADPKFSAPILNSTAPVGREAILTCVVQDLGSYKVAWLRVDTQTILTIQNHVITKNHRVAITYSEKKTWQLKIKDIRESDRGFYMCQINTDPMKSQMGYLDVVGGRNASREAIKWLLTKEGVGNFVLLVPGGAHETCYTEQRKFKLKLKSRLGFIRLAIETGASLVPILSFGENEIFHIPDENTWLGRKLVQFKERAKICIPIFYGPIKCMPYIPFRVPINTVVPPDILDYPTSTDMVVTEGSNVTLKCAATGSPSPTITWRREGGEPISLPGGVEVLSMDGSSFTIPRVNRLHMGAYLCIASNGVPPTVSKRVMLIVHFPPMIWVQNQLVGAYVGQRITLECQSEAYPKSINYWTREKGEIVPQSGKYETMLVDNAYKVAMKLLVKSVGLSDFGSYKCVAKNSLGETDGTIKLYSIPPNTVNAIESSEKKPRGKARKGGNNYDSNDIVDDDPESLSKRKELMVGEHVDESYEVSLSVSISVKSSASLVFVIITIMINGL